MSPVLHGACRLIMGGVFLTAGLAKIGDPIRFFSTLLHFQLFPPTIIPFLAVYIPWLELLLGLSLVFGILHRTSGMLLALLNVLFALAILSLVLRGIEVDCGCFGLLADMLQLPDTADMKTVVRDIIFAFLSLCIFLGEHTVLSLEDYLRRKPV
jgi:putative oxidoreductase